MDEPRPRRSSARDDRVWGGLWRQHLLHAAPPVHLEPRGKSRCAIPFGRGCASELSGPRSLFTLRGGLEHRQHLPGDVRGRRCLRVHERLRMHARHSRVRDGLRWLDVRRARGALRDLSPLRNHGFGERSRRRLLPVALRELPNDYIVRVRAGASNERASLRSHRRTGRRRRCDRLRRRRRAIFRWRPHRGRRVDPQDPVRFTLSATSGIGRSVGQLVCRRRRGANAGSRERRRHVHPYGEDAWPHARKLSLQSNARRRWFGLPSLLFQLQGLERHDRHLPHDRLARDRRCRGVRRLGQHAAGHGSRMQLRSAVLRKSVRR